MIAATRALARREVTRSLRTPAVLIQSVVFPSILLMVLLAVFGTAVGEVTGLDYVQRVGPALIISGAAFGSVGVALGLYVDRTTGFLARLRTLPIAPVAPAAARSVAEHLRVLVLTALLLAVASAFGFRFTNGVVPAFAFVVVAVVCGGSFCWIGMALAARAASQESIVPPVSALFLAGLFLSHGMVPIDAFPGWVQPIVEIAPASVMVLALQRLANGGALVAPIAGALAWTAMITSIGARLTTTALARSGSR